MLLLPRARPCCGAGFRTSEEADRTAAQAVSGGGGWQQRAALCAAIRARERRIYAAAEFAARGRAKALSQAAAPRSKP